jgi:N-acetyl-anhydromuramoyl-L-alanine amidase
LSAPLKRLGASVSQTFDRSIVLEGGWLDKGGWLSRATPQRSPNFDERPSGLAIELLVIHYISLPAGRFSGSCVEDLFLNRLDSNLHPSFAELKGLKVSAHFLIRRSGALIQFVSCDQRAWHAGQSEFEGRKACNDFSIGVEMEGDGEHPFTKRQYQRLSTLTRSLAARYPLVHVRGHSDIAPGRKQDPGPFFDWQQFAEDTLKLSSKSKENLFLSKKLEILARSILSRC